jgi:hypothetical protein
MRLSYPVIIDGVYYNSCNKAANFLKVDERTIINRCRSKNFKKYQFTEYQIPKEKSCSRCKEIKEISNFKKQKNSRIGYSSWCKKCHSEYNIKHSDNIKRKEKDLRYRYSEKGRVAVKFNKEKRRVLENNSVIKLTKEEQNYIKWLHWKVRIMRKEGFDVHLDHIVPVSKGGLYIPENLEIIHAEDNRKKSNKLI